MCPFVCLTPPTLRHSTILKGVDQEKETDEEGGKEKKQKRKKKKLVVVYCTAIITMAIFHCRHDVRLSRDNDGIKPRLRR